LPLCVRGFPFIFRKGNGAALANRRALGWQWLSSIPPEIWLLIAENLGRMGWPHEGRVEVWPF
jgi:hypothetical protein